MNAYDDSARSDGMENINLPELQVDEPPPCRPTEEFLSGLDEDERWFVGELWPHMPITVDGVTYHTFEQVLERFRPFFREEIEEAHAEALAINRVRDGRRERIRQEWAAFTDKERETIEWLNSSGYLDLTKLSDGVLVPPSRHEFHAALRAYNPSVNIGTVANPVKAGWVLLLDSAHNLTCTLEFGDCMECQDEDDREEYGRGLGISGKTQTIFGPQGNGKTWYEVLAAKEAIGWGYNVLHIEGDDSREAMPQRLVLAGVDPLDVARHVKVIMANEIQLTTDSGGKRRPVTPEVPAEFARNIGLVTLDAVISVAAELRLDSTAATLTKVLVSTLVEPFYRRSEVGVHGIIVDHSGHDNHDRPMDSAQKLATVSTAYQAKVIKPLGVGRIGCVELKLRKDRHSIHPGKSSQNGDTVAYMDVDARGESVRVEVYGQHPDKRSTTPAKRGKSGASSLAEIKAAIHEWLAGQDDRTAAKEEIVRGLVGKTKRNGSAMNAKEIRVNLDRINPAREPFSKLSGERFKAL